MKINKTSFNFPNHKYYGAKKKFERKNLFSIIIPTYSRDTYLEECIESAINQTYLNIEIIIVDHCAASKNKKIINDYKNTYNNISIVEFEKNHGQWAVIPVIWNAGLFYSQGEYIYVLSDDDYISKNYTEKMMNLFLENKKCITAGPLPVSVNEKSEMNPGNYLEINQRPKYINGKDLAMNFILSWMNPRLKKFFSAPGGTLAIKKNILMILGGFDDNHDDSQVLKYSILGDVGFDPEAKLFWRHHKQQSNNILKSKGNIFYKTTGQAIKDSGYFYIWKKKFSKKEYKLLTKYTEFKKIFNILGVISESLKAKDIKLLTKILMNTFKECPIKVQYLVFYNLIIRIFKYTKKNIII